MKGFLRYYKWELNNELFASIYFTGLISMYCIEVLLKGERNVDILIMFEMLILCYIISLFQTVIFTGKYSNSSKSLIIRSILWFTITMLLVVVTSISFKWFVHLQSWAMLAFYIYMILFLITIWIGIHMANKIDTKNLNSMLSHYQEKRM
jgi:hypothetical protein